MQGPSVVSVESPIEISWLLISARSFTGAEWLHCDTGVRALAVRCYSPSTDRIVSRIEYAGCQPVSVAHRAPSTMQRN